MEAVLQLFDYIDNTQKPMAIVSNKRHKTLEIEMDHMGWRDRFETVLGAGQADKDKPAPDPLLMALGQMPSKPKMSEILYVGDTETDLLCAKNSGCDVAFVQSDGPRPDLIEKYAPKYHCHSLSELIEHFKGVKQAA
jgi:phosphoglycolate phosphatase